MILNSEHESIWDGKHPLILPIIRSDSHDPYQEMLARSFPNLYYNAAKAPETKTIAYYQIRYQRNIGSVVHYVDSRDIFLFNMDAPDMGRYRERVVDLGSYVKKNVRCLPMEPFTFTEHTTAFSGAWEPDFVLRVPHQLAAPIKVTQTTHIYSYT